MIYDVNYEILEDDLKDEEKMADFTNFIRLLVKSNYAVTIVRDDNENLIMVRASDYFMEEDQEGYKNYRERNYAREMSRADGVIEKSYHNWKDEDDDWDDWDDLSDLLADGEE